MCHRYGLVTEAYSLPYVAHWSGGDVDHALSPSPVATCSSVTLFDPYLPYAPTVVPASDGAS